MGVHGLWELLAPVGRRVSVETLAGKKLAIDASIWMIQFMKAMRDEKGEMVRNAHILGFFRRICKLLYLRTKPVFVFDGGTPALKRRTVIARRRQRENAQAKIRKTAEKLLLNQLKAMRLKELAADLEKQRQENDIKGKKPIIEEPCKEQEMQKGNNDVSISYNQEELDEMLAASIAAWENEGINIGASTSCAEVPDDEIFEEEDDEDEEMILPEMQGKVDPAILAALPPSMQLDLLVQMRERLMAENRQKYQKVKKAPARFSELQIEAYLKTVAFRREIDGVQKSAAGRGIGGVQTSRIASEANREFIFSSSFTGDKEALTSVGEERSRADQSQAPPVNSSANAVKKVQLAKGSGAAAGTTVTENAAAGTTVTETGNIHDDVETYLDERGRLRVSRLRALGIRMTRDLQRNLDLMKEIDQEKAERGQEKNDDAATARNPVDVLDNSSGRIQHPGASDMNNDRVNNEVDKTEEPAIVNGASIEISFEDTTNHNEYDNSDDKLFARLVAGHPVMDFSIDNSAIWKQSSQSASDNKWEEGVIEGKSTEYLYEGGMSDEGEVEWEEGFQDNQSKSSSCPDESQKNITRGALEEEAAFQEAIRRSLEDTRGSMNDFHENHTLERAKEMVSDEEEIEWEEGLQDIQLKSLSCPDNSQKTVTKGALEEEAAFQEAIRRSLEDKSGSMDDFPENHTSERARGTVSKKTACVSACEGKEQPDVETLANDVSRPFSSMNGLDTNHSEAKSAAFIELNPDKLELQPLNQDTGESGTLAGEILLPSDALPGGKQLCMTEKQPLETCSGDGDGLAVCKLGVTGSEKVALDSSSSAFSSAFTDSLHDRLLDSGSANVQHTLQEELGDHFCNTEKFVKNSADDSVTNVDGTKELAKDNTYGNFLREKYDVTGDDNKKQEIMEDHLQEEMMFLGKECEELGNEQRKLERDAESVSNEMFAECQELLQMFGLPYIIAPMEAEAQCAFMELSNLVDGVVTDDSDAFLFGAQSVYKNIFDDRKYVETYLMKDIENELGLDREKLIHMALLLGSDYTEGISGIGIVNAIEVANAFPGKDGLREFREWIESPDPSILEKLNVETGGNSRKKGSKVTENIMSGSNSNVEGISCDQNVPQPEDDDAKRKRQIFMDKHRNVSKNWHISSSFPSDAVISAYASPQVDKSTEPFSWGKPDLFVLRKLCWEKFGWGASKADELLLPVLKEYNKHETQLRLEAFYTFNERFAKIRSKRIKKAVKGITGSKSSELMDETPQQSRSGKKRKVKPCQDEGNQSRVDSTGIDGAGTSTQNKTMEKPSVKQSKRGRTKGKNSKSNLEQSTCVDEHVTRKESDVRGRHRGRGRGQLSGRGNRKNSSCHADTKIRNDDVSCSENDEEMQHVSEEARQVRTSGRLRKTVSYTVSDESENTDKEDETFLDECVMANESLVDQQVGGIDKNNGNQLNEGSDVGMGERLLIEETEQTHRTDKMSTSLIDDGEMDDPSNQGQASNDHLQFGGGFCLDEDDGKEFDGHASNPTAETIPEESDVLTGANSMVEENRESNPLLIRRGSSNGKAASSDNELNLNDKLSTSDYFLPEDTENDSGKSNLKFLRAMPNLRKKRRKI